MPINTIRTLILLTLLFIPGCTKEVKPLAQNGQLDLMTMDLAEDFPVNLDGEWEIYLDRLLSPEDFRRGTHLGERGLIVFPHVWDGRETNGKNLPRIGYATFRLQVDLPAIGAPLALKVANVASACRLWVNGEMLLATGVVGEDSSQEVPKHSLSVSSFTPSDNQLEIVLQVSNHHHITGGVRSSLILGGADQMHRRQAVAWGMSMVLVGILLIFGLYHLVLYLLRRKNISYLLFGVFCTFFGGSSMLAPSGWFIDTMVSGLSWPFLFKFHLFVVFIEVPCVLCFLYSLFPEEGNKTIVRAVAYLSVPFSAVLLFLPVYQATWLLAVYQPIIFLSIGICCRILYLAVRRARDGAGVLLIGFLFFAFTGIHDTLYDKRIINSVYLIPVGLLFFIFSQSLVLARRSSNAFYSVETLSVDLEEKNLRLEEMGRQKDRFIANTSHELKTPLHGIIGITDSVLSGLGGSLSAKVVDNLDIVLSSARRLNTLVDDLLDISLLDKKTLKLNLGEVDLRPLINTVVTVLGPLAERKDLSVTVEIAEDIPLVLADEDRLQQILFNFAGNALKFTDRGGIHISASKEGEMVGVAVTDTGMGIPEDKYAMIFDAFSRIEEGGNKKVDGTGLGLNITKQLVELHGGIIRVDSNVGEGTTFLFTLPVAGNESIRMPVKEKHYGLPDVRFTGDIEKSSQITDATRFPQQSINHAGGPRVLVVDDEPVNLQVAANVLSMENINFTMATSGQQALTMVEEGDGFDLVLLDIMMPGLGGLEVCRQLREMFSNIELPIIMVTARNRLSDLVEGFDSGANDYLTKPYANEELLVRVKIQLELKEAYNTLKENSRLKRELAQRAETELELRVVQRRLSNMLDAAPDPLLAINESDEIAFTNRQFQERTGYTGDELLGYPFSKVVGAGEWQTEDSESSQGNDYKGITKFLEIIKFIKSDNSTFSAAVMLTHIEIDDSLLRMMVLRPEGEWQALTDSNSSEDASIRGELATVALIKELTRNRKRVRDLEESLNGSLPQVVADSPEFTSTIHSIDSALGQMEQLLSKGEAQLDKQQLVVEVMNYSLDYWQKTTGKTKGDMARESKIWKVYTNRDGWDRTQTLDKYLDIQTIPKRPRLSQVLKTGDFVLAASDSSSGDREKLENSLARLRIVA